jgi:excisionase family DNA binding protein
MGTPSKTERTIDFDVVCDLSDEEEIRALLGRASAGQDGKAEDGRRPRRVLPAPDEILTPEEVAEHLGIPKKTVIFLCAEGRLDGCFKAGRRWRVPGRAVRKVAGVP